MTRRLPAPARLLQIGAGLAAIAGLSLLGGVVADTAGLGVPGPVLGMGIYLALLLAAPRVVAWTLPAARLLTGLLGAMIVPAAVGLAAFTPLLRENAAPLVLVLVSSTLVTGLATAGAYALLTRGRGR